MANTVTNTNNLSLRSILEKDKLTGANFLDWERNLMIVLRHERKWYVLEEPLGEAPPANASANVRNAYRKHSDDLLDVGCLMLATMSPDLQTGLMNTNAYDMIRQLRDMFQTQARTERYDATRALNACKMAKGTSVSDHVMKMKKHIDHLERLGHPVPLQLATDTILNSLTEDYKQFVINYNMNNMEKTIAELHSMLKTAELSMGTGTKTKDVLMVGDGRAKRKRGHGNTSKGKSQSQASQSVTKVDDERKGKGKKVKPNKAKTENRCFICHELGHWRRNCPKRHKEGNNASATSDVDQKLHGYSIEQRISDVIRRLRLLHGFSHDVPGLDPARGNSVWSFTGGSISSNPVPFYTPEESLRLINGKWKLTGQNFPIWKMHLDNVLSAQGKLYILEKPVSRPKSNSPEEEFAKYFKYLADESDVMSIMIFSISPEFSGDLRDNSCHEVVKDIENQLGFYKHTGKLLIMKEILSLKLKKNQSIKDHLINMRRLFKCLTRLGYKMAQEELMHLMWYSLPKEICDTASAYMKEPRKHVAMSHEDILASLEPKPASAELMDTDWIDELGDLSCPECGCQDICEHSMNIDQIEIGLPDAPGIFMIDCLITSYESWVIDTGSGNHICNHLQGFTRRETLRKDRSNLRVGEGTPLIAEAVGSYSLSLPSGLVLELENSTPVNGLYTINLQDDNKEIYHISKRSKDIEDQTYLWHCRLSGKMTKEPFNKDNERASDLLEIVHTDVCGPFSHEATGGYRYFITFTDDFSRYGYVYLMRHKSESFEKFREYQNDVQNQLDRKIKFLRKEESYIVGHGTIDDVSLYTTSVILGTCARNSSTYTEQSANNVDRLDAIRIVEGKISQFREHQRGCRSTEPIEEVQTQDIRRSNRVRQEPDSESEQWREAMKAEMQSMYDNQVWELTDLPEHCRAVGRKWVFKKKTDMDGNVHTFKARLVAKGFTQTHGIDYDETFSPVAMLKSIRILMAISAYFNYEIWQMDVKTAFLNGKLTEDVYMEQPEGFEDPKNPNKVCKLQKSIYGLKQASRSWNLHFDERIKEFGFAKCEFEPCVYTMFSGSIVTFLVLYVDDILLIGKDVPTLHSVKSWLSKCFQMKYLGEAAYILGIKIYKNRSRRLIGLSQSTYIDKVLKKFRMDESKKGFIPMQHGIVLSKTQCPVSNQDQDKMKSVPYASTIGSIMYAMLSTRPDVAYSVLRMKLVSSDILTLVSRPTEMISNHSQEYIAASDAAKEAVWLRNFLSDLRVVTSVSRPIDIFCDNSGAVAQAKEPREHHKSRHVLRKYHLIREIIGRGDVRICKIPTEDNVADPLTKLLARVKHEAHANSIGMQYLDTSS
ncbi:hypothetical protein OSB04_031886 [Centaurea solstitialis]|uniref:CCHC-type domain-containing protein n=1 Tax=Centaurea solstitialis TaxID=347529 RepID=A0AA38SVI4_9ASTR|nr:hypothetical protein OSB04_031886 [Centaurea solstitialis]